VTRRAERLRLDGPAGALDALLMRPERPHPGAALLCHPHPPQGGSMHTKALVHTARALESAGLPVLRFDFRGVGRSAGRWSGGSGEREDARAALAWLAARHAGEPLVVGGMSFGAWIGLQVGSESPGVHALVAVAPPLALYDFGFLRAAGPPILCVAGDADPFCPVSDLEALAARLGARLEPVVLPGAQHLLTTHLEALYAAVRRFALERLEPRGGPPAAGL
jgi:alpha/beta superfamily hydrolase